MRINPDDGACRILATAWTGGATQGRGWGTYFVGQWFRYEGVVSSWTTRDQ